VRAGADQGPSLARGAAVISAATAVSRATGFLRVVVVAGAMGTTYLANTYQTANTAPNVVFELVAAGVLTSVFVPTFVEHIVSGDAGEGSRAVAALTSVAVVTLAALAGLLALIAPLAMRLLTIGVTDDALRAREIALGSTWLRMFAPQVLFYGVGMIMTAALHAHRRFALAAIAPIANNVVVIAVYLSYALMRGARPPTLGAITPAEVAVLGIGTTLGVVAMTACLVPGLRRIGWSWRWSWRPTDPIVRRAARLGSWALGYAGGYQAGLVIVLLLANRVRGGVAAYQWAYTFFFVPHALLAIPIGSVTFPAMSEHIARGESEAFLARLREALGMLVFLLVPLAGLLALLAQPVAELTLRYGVMGAAGVALVGRVLAAFALGLPTYSAFLTLTRAYYALGDTRTPALVNAGGVALSSAAGVALFLLLPETWAVPGLALGHSLGFALATVILARLMPRRVQAPTLGLARGVVRAIVLGALALTAAAVVHALLPSSTRIAALFDVVCSAGACGLLYTALMTRARAAEVAKVRTFISRARP
jgi:putative peptidoglycan lipid II flippase